MRMMVHATRYGLRAYLRNRQARVFTLIMPVALLIAFSAIFDGATTRVDGVTQTYSRYFVASILTLSLTSATFAGLLMSIVNQRETGIYKRRRTTPLPAWGLVVSQTLTVVLMGFATSVLLLVIAEVVFGIHAPLAGVPVLAVAIVLGSAAFCGLAFAVSTFVGSTDAAQPAIQGVMLPLFLISGVWISSEVLPPWLNDVAAVFPIERVADLLHRAFADGALDGGAIAADVAVLAAWTVAGIAVAAWRFSWLPQAAGRGRGQPPRGRRRLGGSPA